jgi:hypothetical protein
MSIPSSPLPAGLSLPIPWSGVTKTYSDVLTTIASWANTITAFGAWTAGQIISVLTSWVNMITAFGNLAWSQVTKTATDVLNTIASWANMITAFGAWTTGQITSMLTSWAQMVTAMGNLVWSQVTKTASDVMATISTWANILSQVGAMTVAQITTLLTSTANVISALGNWAWAQITKTATDVMTTISSWTNILNQVGAMTVAQITTTLTSTANIISALGNWTWTQITKTATDVMTTISSWANILTQVGAQTYAQIKTMLTSWAQITNSTALGLIDFATYISNRVFSAMSGTITWAQNCFTTWATLLTQVGAQTSAQITTMLTNWATVITALGNLATTYLSGIIQSAQMALSSLADGFFTGATGLAKFVTGFFTADATGRGKFANLFVTNALINDLDAGKINAGYLAAARIEVGSIDSKIATITNAQIQSLDAGKITTGYLGADRIETASLVVGKLSEEARITLSSTDNLVFNGSFEQDENNDGKPDGWHDYENLISRSSTYSYNGTYSLKIPPQISWNAAESNDILISKRPLVLVFWHRGSGTSGNMFPYITYYDANHAWLETGYTGIFTTTTTWTEYVALIPQANIPSNARYLRIGLDNNDSSVTLYIDDIKLYYQISASAMLADAIIGTAKIVDLAVTNAKIANATIEWAKLTFTSIDNAHIADLAVTNAKIDNATITGAKIASATIDNLHLKTGVITIDKTNADFSWLSYLSKGVMRVNFEALTGYTQVTVGGAYITFEGKNRVLLYALGSSTDEAGIHPITYTIDLSWKPKIKVRAWWQITTNRYATILCSTCPITTGGSGNKGFGLYMYESGGYTRIKGVWTNGGSLPWHETTSYKQVAALTGEATFEARHTGTSIQFYFNGELIEEVTSDIPTSGEVYDEFAHTQGGALRIKLFDVVIDW